MERITAEKLIRQATKDFDMPSTKAVNELIKVLQHNDSGVGPRVGIKRVLEMLRSYKYRCGERKLDAICRRLGRKSFVDV